MGVSWLTMCLICIAVFASLSLQCRPKTDVEVVAFSPTRLCVCVSSSLLFLIYLEGGQAGESASHDEEGIHPGHGPPMQILDLVDDRTDATVGGKGPGKEPRKRTCGGLK